jgi:hypothetical protein
VALVSTALSWDIVQRELLAYLCVSDAERAPQLRLWYSSALEYCETYLGDPFTDDDGTDLAIPSAIKLGLFELVRHMDQTLGPNGRGFGVTSAKTGDLSESYGNRTGGGEITMAGLAEAAKDHWFRYRDNIGA